MPNYNAPFGLRPAKGVNGQVVTGAPRLYSHASGDGTALYIGDLVKLAGTAQTINGVTTPDVVRAATGDVIVGVVVGINPTSRDTLGYGPASTAYTLFVDDDPNSLFEVQDVNSGTALTVNDVGLNANFVVAAGSTYTNQSGTTLDNTSGSAITLTNNNSQNWNGDFTFTGTLEGGGGGVWTLEELPAGKYKVRVSAGKGTAEVEASMAAGQDLAGVRVELGLSRSTTHPERRARAAGRLREEPAVGAEGRDREHGAAEVLWLHLARLRVLPEALDVLRDAEDALPIRVANDLWSVEPAPPFARDDARLQRVPMHVHRPDFAELRRVHHWLAHGRLELPG